ncbi:MAG TPA: hypothetical protein VIK24_05780 [Pyrinomonadaceae bacterium]
MRCSRSMLLRLLCLMVFPVVAGHAQNQTQNNLTTLQQGVPIERTMGANESHSYSINLSDEQYLQFAVDQRGVDVIVRVFSPTGKSLGDFDTPNGAQGPENVSIVALTSGLYRIVVSPLDSNNVSEPGKYEIKILEIRDATEQELKVGKNEDARKAKGLALLNDIIDSIPEIQQPRTRIKVKMQSATLLWSIDEKKAIKLLSEAVTDARDYFLTIKPSDPSYDESSVWAQQIRFEAVQTLALYDPEAALNLFRSTRRPVDTEVGRGNGQNEQQFELALASQIARRNPKRAFELAEESLKEGISGSLPFAISSLQRSNPELAATLAKDVTAKLLEQKLLENSSAAEVAMNLIRNFQNRAEKDRRALSAPFLSLEDFRALVRKAVNEALSASISDGNFSIDEKRIMVMNGNTTSFVVPNPVKSVAIRANMVGELLSSIKEAVGSDLDSIVPGGNAAVDKRLLELRGPERRLSENGEKNVADPTSETTREAINQAPPEIRSELIRNLAEHNFQIGNVTQAKQIISEGITNPRERRQMLNNFERESAYVDISKGRIDDALKHIAKLETMEERAEIISEIASRIGPGQKRSAALALLETARSLLGSSIQAEGHSQMEALLQLAAAFSRYDSKRGFEILDPLVDQYNDLAEAARTMNGFGITYYVDGELLMQNGNSLASVAQQLSTALGILSLTDFDRAKATADRLHLPEVRLPVHLGIVQQAIMPSGIYSPSVANLNSLNR